MKDQILEKRLEEFWQLHNELSRTAFIKRTGLKGFDKVRSVYADGELVYKFNFGQSEVNALERIKGIENVQQLVVYDGHVLVTELIKAKHFKKGTQPKREHLEKLLITLLALRDKSVGFSDIYEGNLLHSQELGFFPIDLYYLGLPQKPDIEVPRLASCMSCSGPKFLDRYLTLLDLFYDLNPKVARDLLKDCVSFSENSFFPEFCGLSATQIDFKKIRTVLEKYRLFCDHAHSCKYTLGGYFRLIK
ncbi:hypothetical protein HZA97_10165 [Candidatus Woesearchaeota archaeon]|nr:hypothetical protein [Candidatus Woesearchaeota archaeon]